MTMLVTRKPTKKVLRHRAVAKAMQELVDEKPNMTKRQKIKKFDMIADAHYERMRIERGLGD